MRAFSKPNRQIWISVAAFSMLPASADASEPGCKGCDNEVIFQSSKSDCVKSQVNAQLNGASKWVYIVPSKCGSKVSDGTRTEAVRSMRSESRKDEGSEARVFLVSAPHAQCLLRQIDELRTPPAVVTIKLGDC